MIKMEIDFPLFPELKCPRSEINLTILFREGKIKLLKNHRKILAADFSTWYTERENNIFSTTQVGLSVTN
jgi:hypothetical protein